jgi:hypothetical protein
LSWIGVKAFAGNDSANCSRANLLELIGFGFNYHFAVFG